MSAALAPNPSRCTRISIGRDAETVTLSAASTVAIPSNKAHPAKTVITVLELKAIACEKRFVVKERSVARAGWVSADRSAKTFSLRS
jgi:hypothetical protein